MNIAVAMYSTVSISYLVMGIITYLRNPYAKANRMFLVISITLFYWAFCLMLMSATENPFVALFYRRLGYIAMVSIYAEILNFVMIITENTKYQEKAWFKILVYLPALITFIIYFFKYINSSIIYTSTNLYCCCPSHNIFNCIMTICYPPNSNYRDIYMF